MIKKGGFCFSIPPYNKLFLKKKAITGGIAFL